MERYSQESEKYSSQSPSEGRTLQMTFEEVEALNLASHGLLWHQGLEWVSGLLYQVRSLKGDTSNKPLSLNFKTNVLSWISALKKENRKSKRKNICLPLKYHNHKPILHQFGVRIHISMIWTNSGQHFNFLLPQIRNALNF